LPAITTKFKPLATPSHGGGRQAGANGPNTASIPRRERMEDGFIAMTPGKFQAGCLNGSSDHLSRARTAVRGCGRPFFFFLQTTLLCVDRQRGRCFCSAATAAVAVRHDQWFHNANPALTPRPRVIREVMVASCPTLSVIGRNYRNINMLSSAEDQSVVSARFAPAGELEPGPDPRIP